MTCLLKQQDCGLKAGDTQCGKCGLRLGEGFPTREDRDLATLKATALYWQNHAKELEERHKRLPAAPVATSSNHAVGEVFKDLPEGPEMVVIPSGSFMMGSAAEETWKSDDECPQHRVTIGYRLAVGKYPVTFAQWDACVTDGGTQHQPEDQGWGRGQRPVINVSWDDAQEYVAWFNRKLGLSEGDPYRYRLLSEAEWEYACRAGTTTAYNTPNGLLSPDDATYNASEGLVYELAPTVGKEHKKTTPVGIYAPNSWGLYDMHGNEWEWVQDGYEESYRGAPADGSAWESGASMRVLRGGSWINLPSIARSAARFRIDTSFRYYYLGFRLARMLP